MKNWPAMRETRVGKMHPQEEGVATHSGIHAWRIPMDGGTWLDTVHRVAKSRTRVSD